jgi:methylenetetrahydrofolate reductase (NADPH)
MAFMKTIKSLLEAKRSLFSFEVFPAKTPEGHEKLLNTLKELCGLKPDFISCTYGAGGGSRERTLDVVQHIQDKHGVAAMAHLTCVLHTRAEIEKILEDIDRRGVNNILALRGDPPQGGEAAFSGDLKFSSELVAFIRKKLGNKVSIGVAGFPEGHMLAPNKDEDAKYLKKKADAGADFVITQLFFDNTLYFEYVERLKKLGVSLPVLPGILPVTDYEGLKRFCERCGASVPKVIHDTFAPIAQDPAKTLQAGIEFAVKQSKELLAGGAPGIHLYTLNKLRPSDAILSSIRK